MLLLFSGAQVAGGVTGTLSESLGAITIDAQGVVGSTPIQGALAATLGAFNLSAAGTVLVQGAESGSLAAITITAHGTVANSGAPSATADILITVPGDGEVADRQLLIFDPGDERLIEFDWDAAYLSDSVTIAVSDFTLTLLRGAGGDAGANAGDIVDDSRHTQVLFDATTGHEGDYYRLSNSITTNESPAQTSVFSIFVLIQRNR